jgi:hypothetical protein
MKLTIVLALSVLAYFTPAINDTTQSPPAESDLSVAVVSPSEGQQCSTTLLPPVKPTNLDFNVGPSCGIHVAQISRRWADPRVPPRSPKGELVSGFKFNGWVEDGKAKVAVWILLNPKDATFATTDDKKLKVELINTYLIESGEKLRLNEVESYGVKPIDLVITTRE